MQDIIAVIAGILVFLSIVPYIADTLRGKTRPNVVSWFTWTLISGIATWVAWSEGAITSAILTGADTLGIGIIMLLAFKFGFSHYTFFDAACQVSALLGLLLWFLTKDANLAMAIMVVVDLVALLPTLRHSWLKPSEETWMTFAVSAFASAMVAVTVPELTFVAVAYPAYLIFGNLLLAVAILYRRHSFKEVT